jgi:hypothetical protein
VNEDLKSIDGLCEKIIEQRARIEALEAALRSLCIEAAVRIEALEAALRKIGDMSIDHVSAAIARAALDKDTGK